MTRQLIESTLRVSTPLIFAALGGMFSERSGVINIALEGLMLIGAFAAAVITYISHSPWLGTAGGMGAAVLMAGLYALFVIGLRANQIVAGTAINMLALGLTPFLCKVLYDVTGQTPAIPLGERFQSAPLYMSWVMVGLCWFWLKYTRGGLWVSFAGEHPEALDAAGIRVNRVRWAAVLMSGALAGLGGLVFVVPTSTNFNATVAGYGFLALAVLIFGQWKPVRILWSALFFGLMKTIAAAYSGIPGLQNLPISSDVYKMIPYIATLIVLAFTSAKSQAPRASGVPYDKSTR